MAKKAAKSRRRRVTQGTVLKIHCSFLKIPTTRLGPDKETVKISRSELRYAIREQTDHRNWSDYLLKSGRTQEFENFKDKYSSGCQPKAA